MAIVVRTLDEGEFKAAINTVCENPDDRYFSVKVLGDIRHRDGEKIPFSIVVNTDEPVFEGLKLGEAPNFLKNKKKVARAILHDMALTLDKEKDNHGNAHAFFHVVERPIVSWHSSQEGGIREFSDLTT